MKQIFFLVCAVVLMAVATRTARADKGRGIWGGLVNYTPNLEEVREELAESGQGNLTAEQDTGWMVGLYAAGKKAYWTEASYGRWSGEADRGTFAIDVHHISASAFFQTPKTVTPLLGVGSTIIYLHREGSASMRGLDVTNNDWLWGLHGWAGLRRRISKRVSLEGRYFYLWSKPSTLGGIEYDLGDAFWLVAVGLQF